MFCLFSEEDSKLSDEEKKQNRSERPSKHPTKTGKKEREEGLQKFKNGFLVGDENKTSFPLFRFRGKATVYFSGKRNGGRQARAANE